MRKRVLFVTYTMSSPTVAGVFLRAVRVASEMARRGWEPVIFNQGPWIADPKVEAARELVEFRDLHRSGDASTDQKRAHADFADAAPDVVVMGEGPFALNRPYYDAAMRLGTPFVILDQYYKSWQIPPRPGVDLALHYALATFWDDILLEPPNELMPPFIEEVAAKASLPVPEHLHARPWVTLVANDAGVVRRGLELLSRVRRDDAVFVIVTRNAERLQHDLPRERTILLPQQQDSIVFGLLASSAVTLAANGFMQIMECVALACPIVALQRDCDVGTGTLEVAEQFRPFASVREDTDRQLARLHEWLEESPFSESARTRLQAERHGLAYCVNRIEQVVRSTRPRKTPVARAAAPSWLRRAAGTLLVRFGQWMQG